MRLTPQELRTLFDYNPYTGEFSWRVTRGTRTKIGDKAGCVGNRGYYTLCYKRRPITAHRAAWAIVYGAWPRDELDHINGDKEDNRISNLRECSRLQNEYNKGPSPQNRLGIRGVKASSHGKYYAQIRIEGRLTHLGTFETAEEAEAAYKQAAERVCGSFAAHLSRNRDTTP